MAIVIPTPNLDDLKHQPVFGSSIDRATDLYTDDSIQVLGGAAAATVRIHGGNDTVYGNNSADTIYDNRAINGRPFVGPDGSIFIPAGAGPSGNDAVFAGGGKDTIFAGDGQNYYDGGGETDTVDYSRASVGVSVDLDTGNGQGQGVGDGVDTLVSIENVTGSRFDDTIAGSSDANVLRGGAGKDYLLGGGGQDTLYGGEDDDMLDGGEGPDKIYGDGGIDTLVYLYSPQGVVVNLAKATASGGDAQGDSFKSIENLWGSMYDDTLTGDGADNVLFGSKGRDVLSGGGGNDRFLYNSPDESTVANPDLIKGFVHGEDIIDLSGLDNVLQPFDTQATPSMTFVNRFSGVAGQVTAVAQSNATMVYADLDGDRVADFAIRLTGSVQLTAEDFWL